MQILFDARWIGDHGIGRFAREYRLRAKEIVDLQSNGFSPEYPLDPLYLTARIIQIKPDVFFSPGFNPPLYSSIPFVFTLHDLNHIDLAANSNWLKRQYYQHIIKPAAFSAACVLTVSEFSKQNIIRWLGLPEERVWNVGNGVDKAFHPKGMIYKPGYPYFFYLGNRKGHKNVPRLLEAFALSKASNEIKLLISGYKDAQLSQLIEDYKLSSKVVFAGAVSEEDLPAYYRGAQATVFPSLYEGFGLPILESMATGTPVLTSNLGAPLEVAGKAGLLVDPYSIDSIRQGLDALLDSSLCLALKQAGLQRATMFSWDKVYQEIEGAITKALSFVG